MTDKEKRAEELDTLCREIIKAFKINELVEWLSKILKGKP